MSTRAIIHAYQTSYHGHVTLSVVLKIFYTQWLPEKVHSPIVSKGYVTFRLADTVLHNYTVLDFGFLPSLFVVMCMLSSVSRTKSYSGKFDFFSQIFFCVLAMLT